MADLYTTLALVGGIGLLSIAGLWIFFRRSRSRNVFPEETWDSFQTEEEADSNAPGPPRGVERIGGDVFAAEEGPPGEAGAARGRENAPLFAHEKPGGDVEPLAGAPSAGSFAANGGTSGEAVEDLRADGRIPDSGKRPWWETLSSAPGAAPRRTVAQLMGIGLGDAPSRPAPKIVSQTPPAEAEKEEEISLSTPGFSAPGAFESASPFIEEDETAEVAAPIDAPGKSFDPLEDMDDEFEAAEEAPDVVGLEVGEGLDAPAAAGPPPDDESLLLPEDEGPNFFDVLQSLPEEEAASPGASVADVTGEKEEDGAAAPLAGDEEAAPAVFSGEEAAEDTAEISLESIDAPNDLTVEEAAVADQKLAPEPGGEGEQPFAMETMIGGAGEDEPAFFPPAEVEAGMAADVEAKIGQEAGPGAFMQEERVPVPAAETPPDESGAEEIFLGAETAEEEGDTRLISELPAAEEENSLVSEEAAGGEEMVLEPEEAISEDAPFVFAPDSPGDEISSDADSQAGKEIVLDLADASAEEEIELLEDEEVSAPAPAAGSAADASAGAESIEDDEMVLLSEGEEEPLDVFSVMGEPGEEEPAPAAAQAPPPAGPPPGMVGEAEEESSIWGDDEEEETPSAPPAEAPAALPASEPKAASPAEVAAPAPSGSPLAQISGLVSEICPGDLIYLDARDVQLPAGAESAAAGAHADIEAREGGREKPLSEEYLRLGIAELFLGRGASAVVQLKEALRRSDRLGPVLNALAVAMYDQGKIDPAISYCREAIREAGSNRALQNAVQRNLALLYLEKGDAARAAEFTEAAIEGMDAGGALDVKAQLHLRAGQLFRRLGDLEKARHHLYEANLLFQKGHNGILRVRSLVGLAAIQGDLGEIEASLKNLEEAMHICQGSGDKAGEALVLGQMGIAYSGQDQFTRALEYYEQALALHRELGSDKGIAANLSNIGNIHYFRGDLAEAQSAYEAALGINRKEGHPIGQATTLGNLGRVFFERESYAQARVCLNEARDLFRGAGAEEQLANVRQVLEEVERAENS
ncbi:MAG: tetratricopeptide repeat protein [bacterium]|nr:tetratricopeptide repeat protein [bacterium]